VSANDKVHKMPVSKPANLAEWTVDVENLYKACDPSGFDFAGTDELSPLSETIGQQRAIEAIEFGLDIESPGFNIFVMGSTGTGRRTTIQRIVSMLAVAEDTPDDWIYVHNFRDSSKPKAIWLPSQRGAALREDMEQFSNGLAERLSQAFETEQYAAVRRPLELALQMNNQQELSTVAVASQKSGFTLVNSPSGLYVAPVYNGEILTPEILSSFPQDQQLKLEKERQRLDTMLNTALRRIRDAERKTYAEIRELDSEVADYTIQPVLNELNEKYADLPQVLNYFKAVRDDIVNKVEILRIADSSANTPEIISRLDVPLPHRFRINLLVDNSNVTGAPVVVVDAPTYEKLFGYIEYSVRNGVTDTNHTLIKAGALHQANGGYLILDAATLLESPNLWTVLKRTLFNRMVTIESPGGQGMVRTITPTPESIPLDVKVILHGVPYIYYGLYQMDEDFAKLFKVQADFHSKMDRTIETEKAYAEFIHTLCVDENLLPFEPEAVARIVEYGVRLAGHQKRLSTRFGKIADIIRESVYWAGKTQHLRVIHEDVNRAIQHARYRSSLSEEQTLKDILEDTIRVTTTGMEVGEVNALMVQSLGGFKYGVPSRVSAQVYIGRGNVLSIQREVQLSGPIHNKGVLTLTGYFGGQYGKTQQLSMEASISMEQVYDGIEGDSASSAELYALISAVSGIPLRQDIAVTGAVDQYGRILAIGGVNEKVEGFFKICSERGLTGKQGVIIPVDNIKNLMLDHVVVEAVRDGLFHIYNVSSVDEGLFILTGRQAGFADEEGQYSSGSIHASVISVLQKYTQHGKGQESETT
jgi:lon-related putative ATP-dependent protease